jgi:hypothetical protein
MRSMLDTKTYDWLKSMNGELEHLPVGVMDAYREKFSKSVHSLRIGLTFESVYPGHIIVSPVLEELHIDNGSEATHRAGLTAVLWLFDKGETANLKKLLTEGK